MSTTAQILLAAAAAVIFLVRFAAALYRVRADERAAAIDAGGTRP